VLELWDGIKKNDKYLINYTDLHKIKQQVDECIVGTLLVLGQAMNELELTRVTTAYSWGKPPPFPL
jgi:hypothetical protein